MVDRCPAPWSRVTFDKTADHDSIFYDDGDKWGPLKVLRRYKRASTNVICARVVNTAAEAQREPGLYLTSASEGLNSSRELLQRQDDSFKGQQGRLKLYPAIRNVLTAVMVRLPGGGNKTSPLNVPLARARALRMAMTILSLHDIVIEP